jgi:hypothetical protein
MSCGIRSGGAGLAPSACRRHGRGVVSKAPRNRGRAARASPVGPPRSDIHAHRPYRWTGNSPRSTRRGSVRFRGDSGGRRSSHPPDRTIAMVRKRMLGTRRSWLGQPSRPTRASRFLWSPRLAGSGGRRRLRTGPRSIRGQRKMPALVSRYAPPHPRAETVSRHVRVDG